MPRSRCAAVPAIAVLASACLSAAPPETTVARDSAGIRIVESHAPAWAGPEQAWSLSAEPLLTIGVQEGDPSHELYRVTGARRLTDARIVVANAGTSELRFFDADGHYLMSVGRRGQGPGEFHEFSALTLCVLPDGDLVVADGRVRRLHVFSAAGDYVRTFMVEAHSTSGRVSPVRCFGDGSWLGFTGESLEGAPDEVIRVSGHYWRFDGTGRLAGAVIDLPDRPRLVNQVGDIRHYPYIPLTPEALVTTASDALFVARGEAAEIERRTPDGALQALIRWNAERRPSRDVYDRYKEESLASMRGSNQVRYARLYAKDLPVPGLLPIYQQLRVDDGGNLWVERYRLPWESAPRWDIFDTEGRWLGTVDLPPELRPLHIGDDFLLGRQLDDLRVERVVLYGLRKPERAAARSVAP